MGKGGKAPRPTPAQEEAERLNLELMRTNLAAAKKPATLNDLRIPEPQAFSPAPSRNAADVLAAEYAARWKSGRRTNAGARTLFAGNTGGYKGPGAPARTLLG